MVAKVEAFVFRFRFLILAALMAFTVLMGVFALQLRLDAGFEKQLPKGHEYIETFFEYQDQQGGSNSIIIVLRANEGNIWNPKFMAKLNAVTQDVFFLPGVARSTVTSLWTPNTRYLEVTEDGFIAGDVIPGTITAGNMSDEDIPLVQNNVIRGGFVGRLVANDFSAAMVRAELQEINPKTREKLDYFELASQLETQIREKHENEDFTIHIVGFAKMIGDIAEGAQSVMMFFALAFVLTAASVYFYSRSLILTFVPLVCSLVSLVWQFGILTVLGFGLDPLAILVPFLVFAIGVSHGVQQINLISKEITAGANSMEAAKASFRQLLIPGSMALVTDLVGFGTLYWIKIGMIQELAITASIGVALKIVTNLLMLPLLASYFQFDAGYKERITRARAQRDKIMLALANVAKPRNAIITFTICVGLFAVAYVQSQDRHVGDLHAGAPEMRPDARYNVDSRAVVERFSIGLDVLTVIVETPAQSCVSYGYMRELDKFSWHMANVPGVTSVLSLPTLTKVSAAGWAEGNLKFTALPRNRSALVQATDPIPKSSGLYNESCSLMPVMVFTADHKATTINEVIGAVKQWRQDNPVEGITYRLASGNVGIWAATNEVIAESELPMMLAVYAVIIILVFGTYRDWRATVCCCLPLTLATFLGYWFMKELEIGLKVATLPVMVLAVGIGVDYAFYIFSRLQVHINEGMNVTDSYRQTLLETGNAVIFTAITLAVGVATWSLSELQFQADMGLLLTFMFMVNMICAVTALPALAVILDMIFPRKAGAKIATGIAH